MSAKISPEIALQNCKNVHGDRYDYSLFQYENCSKKLTIICKTHGQFLIGYSQFHKGQNCKKCMYEGGRKIPKKLTKENFISRSNEKHAYKYNYDLVDYKNNKINVIIMCPIHGPFNSRPDQHLRGCGCIKCSGTFQYTLEDFIERAVQKHGSKYDYSKSVYKNNDTKINVICPTHGPFLITAKDHIKGSGCWFCFESLGERKISEVLNFYKLNFIRQHRFKNCVGLGNNKFPFDFYLPELNLCIEYDGEQHFSPQQIRGISKEKAQLNFDRCQVNDLIKTNYCRDNNIDLLRIPFTEFKNIEEILTKKLLLN